jgi:hypothetical protein
MHVIKVTNSLHSALQNIANDPFLEFKGDESASCDYIAEISQTVTEGLLCLIKEHAQNQGVSTEKACAQIIGIVHASYEAPKLHKYAVALEVKYGKDKEVELYVFNALNENDAIGQAFRFAVASGPIVGYQVKEV